MRTALAIALLLMASLFAAGVESVRPREIMACCTTPMEGGDHCPHCPATAPSCCTVAPQLTLFAWEARVEVTPPASPRFAVTAEFYEGRGEQPSVPPPKAA